MTIPEPPAAACLLRAPVEVLRVEVRAAGSEARGRETPRRDPALPAEDHLVGLHHRLAGKKIEETKPNSMQHDILGQVTSTVRK